MLVKLRQLRTFLFLSAMAGMVGVSCAQTDDPFEVGRLKEYRDGATPTSVAVQIVLTATPTALAGETPSIQKVETDTPSEAIRIVTWEDNRVKLVNFILGYLLVHGHMQKVEMVEIESENYKSTLLDKEADVVMEMSASWHASLKETDPVTAVASPYTSEPDLMIGINSTLIERAPKVVNLLEAFKPGEKTISDLTNRMTGGRMGLRDNVAAVIFFKQNEDVWKPWVSADVADRVAIAVAEGNNSLCKEWINTIRGPFTIRVCQDEYVEP